MTSRTRFSPLAPYRADPVAIARFKAAPFLEEAGGFPLPWPMRPSELITVLGAGWSALVIAFTVLSGTDRVVQFSAVMAVTGTVACLVYPGSVAVRTRRLRLAQARTASEGEGHDRGKH